MLHYAMLADIMREEGFDTFSFPPDNGYGGVGARVRYGEYLFGVMVRYGVIETSVHLVLRDNKNDFASVVLRDDLGSYELADPECFGKLFAAIRAFRKAHNARVQDDMKQLSAALAEAEKPLE